jgi:hypothetical protein
MNSNQKSLLFRESVDLLRKSTGINPARKELRQIVLKGENLISCDGFCATIINLNQFGYTPKLDMENRSFHAKAFDSIKKLRFEDIELTAKGLIFKSESEEVLIEQNEECLIYPNIENLFEGKHTRTYQLTKEAVESLSEDIKKFTPQERNLGVKVRIGEDHKFKLVDGYQGHELEGAFAYLSSKYFKLPFDFFLKSKLSRIENEALEILGSDKHAPFIAKTKYFQFMIMPMSVKVEVQRHS